MAGNKVIDLDRTTGNTFEAHSAEMSVVGTWTMVVTVGPGWRVPVVDNPLLCRSPAVGQCLDDLSPGWVFGSSALLGFLVGIAGLIAIG